MKIYNSPVCFKGNIETILKEKKKKKLFVCKSKRLAGYLVSHGCECVKVDTDKLNPKYSVYLFEKTELWNAVMKEWSKKE